MAEPLVVQHAETRVGQIQDGYSVAMQPDPYGIPTNTLGPVDPELPALIGRVVMLTALLETRVSALRAGLESTPESVYAGLQMGANVTAARHAAVGLRSVLGDLAEPLDALLGRLDRVNTSRNELVHRVWAKASLVEWAGWKPLHKRKRDPASARWTDWQSFTREDLIDLVQEVLELIDATTTMYNSTSHRLQYPPS